MDILEKIDIIAKAEYARGWADREEAERNGRPEGHWITIDDNTVACSECGLTDRLIDGLMRTANFNEKYAHFCSNCGAKMTEGELQTLTIKNDGIYKNGKKVYPPPFSFGFERIEE